MYGGMIVTIDATVLQHTIGDGMTADHRLYGRYHDNVHIDGKRKRTDTHIVDVQTNKYRV